jgi:tetratricopeptide (TPR) repeat protein
MMKRGVFLLVAAMMIAGPTMAQQERSFIREGNALFNAQKFEEAEVSYRKALEQKDRSYLAAFNLADALFQQGKYDEAMQQYTSLAKDADDPELLGELFHNMGNTLLTQGKLDECIEAYKQSLRNRPSALDTKYNLEYARKLKKEQEEKEQDQQNKDNKDQDKDQQDKNQDQQDKEQQDKDQQDKQQQDSKDQQQEPKDQQSQPQPNEAKISPEDAKRLLNALEAEEQKTQEKVQKEKAEALKAKRMKIEKNW